MYCSLLHARKVMKQKVQAGLLLTLMAIISVFSFRCSNPVTPVDSTVVQTTIAGIVTDISGTPISNASVSIEGTVVKTNSFGAFIAKRRVPKDRFTLRVEKANYFTAYKAAVPTKDGLSELRIALAPAEVAGNVSSTSGGTVSVGQSTAQVALPAQSVATKSGSAYSGTVQVVARHQSPDDVRFAQEFQGDLRAIREDNSTTSLQSFGVLNVELKGSNGEELQLANGKEATLTFPIAQSQRDVAPTTIPLWFYDAQKNIWVEEGFATKNGTNYVGTVRHFTPWNVDVPVPTGTINVTTKCQNDVVPGIVVTIDGQQVVTNQEGKATITAPAGREIRVWVSERLNNGEYAAPKVVTVPANSSVNVEILLQGCPAFIKGTFGCGDSPLSGTAIATFGTNQHSIAFSSNGRFTLRVPSGQSSTVKIVTESGVESDAISVNALGASETFTIPGFITVCGSANKPTIENWILESNVDGSTFNLEKLACFGTAISRDESKLAVAGFVLKNGAIESLTIAMQPMPTESNPAPQVTTTSFSNGEIYTMLQGSTSTLNITKVQWNSNGELLLITMATGRTLVINPSTKEIYPTLIDAISVIPMNNNPEQALVAGASHTNPRIVNLKTSAPVKTLSVQTSYRYGIKLHSVSEDDSKLYYTAIDYTSDRIVVFGTWDINNNVQISTTGISTGMSNGFVNPIAHLSLKAGVLAISDQNSTANPYTSRVTRKFYKVNGDYITTTTNAPALFAMEPNATSALQGNALMEVFDIPSMSLSKTLLSNAENATHYHVGLSYNGTYAFTTYVQNSKIVNRVWKLK